MPPRTVRKKKTPQKKNEKPKKPAKINQNYKRNKSTLPGEENVKTRRYAAKSSRPYDRILGQLSASFQNHPYAMNGPVPPETWYESRAQQVFDPWSQAAGLVNPVPRPMTFDERAQQFAERKRMDDMFRGAPVQAYDEMDKTLDEIIAEHKAAGPSRTVSDVTDLTDYGDPYLPTPSMPTLDEMLQSEGMAQQDAADEYADRLAFLEEQFLRQQEDAMRQQLEFENFRRSQQILQQQRADAIMPSSRNTSTRPTRDAQVQASLQRTLVDSNEDVVYGTPASAPVTLTETPSDVMFNLFGTPQPTTIEAATETDTVDVAITTEIGTDPVPMADLIQPRAPTVAPQRYVRGLQGSDRKRQRVLRDES